MLQAKATLAQLVAMQTYKVIRAVLRRDRDGAHGRSRALIPQVTSRPSSGTPILSISRR